MSPFGGIATQLASRWLHQHQCPCSSLCAIAPLLVALTFTCSAVAEAQSSAPPGEQSLQAPLEVTLPRLVDLVPAEYPSNVPHADVSVLLHVTVGTDGQVSNVTVVQSGGEAFDRAAIAAAQGSRFVPALRAGTPIAAKIPLRYDFTPPSRVPDPALAPPTPVGSDPSRSAPTVNSTPTPARPGALPNVATSARSSATSTSQPEGARESIEVTVRGKSDAERLRESSQAVKVVETESAKRQSADLGEILARSEGVGVRRGGGLGSTERISLAGLTDDQVRFLIDGVPVEFGGYGLRVSSIPVNFVERAEIYQGVVPVRFGADALGGAINVVTDREVHGSHGSISQQVGSFGTYRTTLGAQHLDRASGLYARANAFVDRARNDYPIDVEVPDETGQLHPATVRRFHDGYEAQGVGVEVGAIRIPWARRVNVRVFANESHKDVQHNVVMTVPYGEVVWGESTLGATARYDQRIAPGVFLEALVGHASATVYYRDLGDCVYDWYGQCVNERRIAGEVESDAADRETHESSSLLRPTVTHVLGAGHTLRASVSASLVERSGRDLETTPGTRDPLNARRDLYGAVSGLEYELDAFDDRLENTAFAKHYLQYSRSEEVAPGNVLLDRERDTSRPGVGNAVRLRVTDFLYAKASYEWATRLPRADEVFGDGAQVIANLELEPERSHNANLGFAMDLRTTQLGDLRCLGNGFLRDADQLIVLLGNDRVYSYQNVYGARSLGWEAALGWTAPREYVSIDGNLTWQEFRNTSSKGTFGDFEGDRIPNRPWLFANLSAAAKAEALISPRDELLFGWHARYVKEYFRGWESVGLRQFKQTVPSQLVHGVALTYVVKAASLTSSSTLEVQNLTNEKAHDFFGVQRPGRAFFWKGTLEI